jgi:AAA15 family ATPase/GTPase
MKISRLQISNILSFKYFDDIKLAPQIDFDTDLNIFIGQNGAGKSTALEALNLVFKKIFLTQININRDTFFSREDLNEADRKQILLPGKNNSYD